MGSCLERTEIPGRLLTYKQTTTFRAIPVLTEHSYWTCRPLRTHCSGSVDTSGLKHKHTKLIIMTFWFLIREQNAPLKKPPEFSRKSPVLCAFMVWPHPLNNFCSGSTAKSQLNGTVLGATCDVVWCPLHLITTAINPLSLFILTEPAPQSHAEDVLKGQHGVIKQDCL